MTSLAITPAPRRRAQLLRYSLWQFRDYAINLAVLTIILFGLLGSLEIMQLRIAGRSMMDNPRLAATFVAMQTQSFGHMFTMYSAVGPIIALSGVVSQDRAMGYVRFLFAKPLNPLKFYVQSLIVRCVGYFGVAAILIACYRAFEPTAAPARIAAGLALFFIAFGGLVFLGSVLSKYDGLGTIGFLLLSVLAWNKGETSNGVFHYAAYLFPPIEKFSALNDWVSNLNAINPRMPAVFPTKWVIWTVCYGVACLVLGVIMLRKRPLARA